MNELTKIANYIILYGRYQSNPGLFNGKAGMMLSMFLFSQKIGISVYRDFAEDLLDDVQKQLYDNLPLGMKDGLTGIAYSMSFLANKNFLSFNQNEILCDLDNKIMNSDPRRITDYSFENGALGIWVYINERLKSTQKLTSIDGMYIRELEDSLRKNGILCENIKLIDQLAQPTFSINDYRKQKLNIDGGVSYYLLKHSLSYD